MIVNNTSELSFWDKNWTKNSKSLGYSMSEFLTHKIAAIQPSYQPSIWNLYLKLPLYIGLKMMLKSGLEKIFLKS